MKENKLGCLLTFIENHFNLYGENGVIEWESLPSPVFGAPHQYVWSITAYNHDDIVYLNFTHLQIPHCNDSSLRIYDAASPFITLCGYNATSGTSVQSSSNRVVIVLETGSCLEQQGPPLKIGANYTSQKRPSTCFKY